MGRFYWEETWPEIIAKQESLLRYDEFNRETVLELGMTIVKLAQEKYNKSVAIRIIEDGTVTFAYKMAGTSSENDWWMDKKLATSRLTGKSSLRSYVDAEAGLAPADWEGREDNFATCGGCIPVFMKDGRKPFAHVIVSNLAHQEDHQIVADAMALQLGVEIPSIL